MSDPPEEDPRRTPPNRFDDDLIGLDPDDPEARAFAEHLERVEQVRPNYTVEGYLAGMSDFADGANRLGGHHRLMAGLLVVLILLGVAVAAWDALAYVVATLFN
ncbi:hypothetical protein [Actinophytocola sp.]|uniref:hypothetical protein n=1 Tax=Actinophytocola sp. TaxID=1872138 RepID=UPI002D8098C4|nr:hypothetical protein [Actinophytocola sp.]HET9138912.1 hypothetical protein [Actinophytocola sp.]